MSTTTIISNAAANTSADEKTVTMVDVLEKLKSVGVPMTGEQILDLTMRMVKEPECVAQIDADLEYFFEEKRQLDEYTDPNSLLEAAEFARKKAEAERLEKARIAAYEAKLRREASRYVIVNMGIDVDDPSFAEKRDERYRFLKGHSVTFTDLGAFVPDMEKDKMTEDELRECRKAEISHRIVRHTVKERMTCIANGTHRVSISEIGEAYEKDGDICQKVVFEDDETGFKMANIWNLSNPADYRFWGNILDKVSKEADDIYAKMDGDVIVEALKKSGLKIWTITRASAKEYNGVKYPRVFFTEKDFQYYLHKWSKEDEAAQAEYEAEKAKKAGIEAELPWKC